MYFDSQLSLLNILFKLSNQILGHGPSQPTVGQALLEAPSLSTCDSGMQQKSMHVQDKGAF